MYVKKYKIEKVLGSENSADMIAECDKDHDGYGFLCCVGIVLFCVFLCAVRALLLHLCFFGVVSFLFFSSFLLALLFVCVGLLFALACECVFDCLA